MPATGALLSARLLERHGHPHGGIEKFVEQAHESVDQVAVAALRGDFPDTELGQLVLASGFDVVEYSPVPLVSSGNNGGEIQQLALKGLFSATIENMNAWSSHIIGFTGLSDREAEALRQCGVRNVVSGLDSRHPGMLNAILGNIREFAVGYQPAKVK